MFPTKSSKANPLLQFSVCASVVSYVAFVLSLFVPHLLFYCRGKVVVRYCAFPGYFHIFLWLVLLSAMVPRGWIHLTLSVPNFRRHVLFYFNILSFGTIFICKVERLNVKQRRSRWSHLIWIYAVCKSLLAVKEFKKIIGWLQLHLKLTIFAHRTFCHKCHQTRMKNKKVTCI